MDILSIENPQFLKNMKDEELVSLAQDIRAFLIEKCSIMGGHIGPNLGVVELTIALHKEFDCPHDKLIWDVGHQTYVHKILTGRAKQFSTLRTYRGLSGFPKREESDCDVWETGHSSTSLSASAGISLARDLQNKTYETIAIIGDGALTGGMALEALNNIGHEKLNIIVILNDNAMSIAPNVGAINIMLEKMRVNSQYRVAKKKIKGALEKTPMIGNKMSRALERLRNSIKYFFVRGMFFEELGFTYIGLIDGHDFEKLSKSLQIARKTKGPVIVHVATKKGKGYAPAEEDKTGKWHGIGPYNINTGETVSLNNNTAPSWSDIMSNTVLKLAKRDEKIVVLTPAMMVGSKLSTFHKNFPNRIFDVGIAEQHATTMAAGFAVAGMKPYLVIYSTFLQRAYDQVLHDIARQNLPVVIGIDRAGLVGEDGDTHQGVFDIAFLRHIPNMTITMPKDENEAQHLLSSAFKYKVGPVAVRFPRGNGTGVKLDSDFLEIPYGTWEILREGKDIVILTFGPMIQTALLAAENLKKKKISVQVVNARFIKPVDEAMLKCLFTRQIPILTLEEGVLAGGFGSLILEFASELGYGTKRINRLGIPDQFVEHGKVELLYNDLALTVQGVENKIIEMIDRKNKNEN